MGFAFVMGLRHWFLGYCGLHVYVGGLCVYLGLWVGFDVVGFRLSSRFCVMGLLF